MDLNSDLPGLPDFIGREATQTGAAAPLGSLAGEINQIDVRLQAQDDERLRLGRELHDSTGQLLLALRLGISHLRQVHGTGAEDSALDEIEETALNIDREIRSFAFTHYPAEIGRDGLAVAVQCLARGFGLRTGLDVKFLDHCHVSLEDGPVALALLRVAQEALTNIHRHASAARVWVRLTSNGDSIELSVRDDGRGISPEFEGGSFSGVGLQGMRHRMERLAGQFSVRRLKQGTRLVARAPMPA